MGAVCGAVAKEPPQDEEFAELVNLLSQDMLSVISNAQTFELHTLYRRLRKEEVVEFRTNKREAWKLTMRGVRDWLNDFNSRISGSVFVRCAFDMAETKSVFDIRPVDFCKFIEQICLCTLEDLFDCLFMAMAVPMRNSTEKYLDMSELLRRWKPFDKEKNVPGTADQAFYNEYKKLMSLPRAERKLFPFQPRNMINIDEFNAMRTRCPEIGSAASWLHGFLRRTVFGEMYWDWARKELLFRRRNIVGENKSLFAHINAKHVKQQRELDSGREILDSVVARQKQPEFAVPKDGDDVVELANTDDDVIGDEIKQKIDNRFMHVDTQTPRQTDSPLRSQLRNVKRIEPVYSPVNTVPDSPEATPGNTTFRHSPKSIKGIKAQRYRKTATYSTTPQIQTSILAGLDALGAPTLYPAKVTVEEKLSPKQAKRFRSVKSFTVERGTLKRSESYCRKSTATVSPSYEPGSPKSLKRRWQASDRGDFMHKHVTVDERVRFCNTNHTGGCIK